MNKSPLERLRIKSKRTHNGCVEWQGSRYKSRGKLSYGQMWYEGKNTKAHRVAWIENKGPIPKGLNVLHSCDNRICVNPDHLFLGTHTDNMRDMIKKGRKALFYGEDNGKSKLTEEQVLAIRKDNRTNDAIARDYNIASPTVSTIRTRKKWGWL